MPFTFSHVAAVLPARRYFSAGAGTSGARARRFIDFPALAIGAMAPDACYVVALVGPYVETHTGSGAVVAAWPVALVAYAAYRRVLAKPWHELLPWLDDGVHALHPLAILGGTLVGVLSHVVWDAFTHIDGAAVLQWPWLARPLAVGRWEMPLCDALQDGSSIVGAFFVALAMARAVRRRPGRRFTTSWRRFAALMVVFSTLWAALAVAVHARFDALPEREYWSQMAFAGLAATLVVFVVYGLGARACRAARDRKQASTAVYRK